MGRYSEVCTQSDGRSNAGHGRGGGGLIVPSATMYRCIFYILRSCLFNLFLYSSQRFEQVCGVRMRFFLVFSLFFGVLVPVSPPGGEDKKGPRVPTT